jgi:hypothetical protein
MSCLLDQFHDPELRALIDTAEERMLSTGKYLSSVVYPGLSIGAMVQKGTTC